MIKKDILIIGSGLAGLGCALNLNKKFKIGILSKASVKESSTFYAQGGIAAVNSIDDSCKSHIQDTMIAGAGLCDEKVVEKVVSQGRSLIQDLINWGVDFTKLENIKEYDLTKEGGHTKRRIFHKDDNTGAEIENKLLQNIFSRKNIEIFENHTVINIITDTINGEIIACGVYALDNFGGEIITFEANYIILATGGAGKVYLYTSNPDISSGDGIAIGYRAGAIIANMEFMQFHPTCLYHPDAKSFLISESLRGEGAKLKLEDGAEFMKSYHELKELAPRDIVARAIDFEMKKLGITNVYLDITHKDPHFVKKRFPTIYKNCLNFGIDITKDLVPIVPASHYTCGGVKTDIDGRTNIKDLFAIGEVASTGLHGANRLASNSLLEAIFFAKRVAKFINKNFEPKKFLNIKKWNIGKAIDSNETVLIQQNWEEIRKFMWNYVGIVRTDKRLMRAKRRIELLKKEIQEYYWDFKLTKPLLELRNLATVAEIIILSASKRKESRGLHYNLDYPKKLKIAKNTLLKKN
ncbi:MAG: L-aspartate oxidase [Elusimicrobiota bacterium]|nr:L-aspartate oxidase [Elusimicrobiota bacterium]